MKEVNAYLDKVLKSLSVEHIKEEMEAHRAFRDEVKSLIKENFQGVFAPYDSGSLGKHTAINTNFDFDLVVPFRFDSFESLEKMHGELDRFLKRQYPGCVRKQRVSSGISGQTNRFDVNLDVIPGRELRKGDYNKSQNLQLYVTDEGRRSIQTNIKKQIQAIRKSNEKGRARDIVKLLKHWKYSNDVKIKSFILELFTIKAYSNVSRSPRGLCPQLLMVLEYIHKHVKTIRLIDPGNSNNDVLRRYSDNQKSRIRNSVGKLLDEFEDDYEELFLGNRQFMKGRGMFGW